MLSSKRQQIKLTVWKNWKILGRCLTRVVWMILLPVIIILIYSIAAFVGGGENFPDGVDAQYYSPFVNYTEKYNFAYSYDPASSSSVTKAQADSLAATWLGELNRARYAHSSDPLTPANIVYVEGVDSMADWCADENNNCFGGVVFEDLSSDNVKYSVRVDAKYTGNTKDIYNPFAKYATAQPYDGKYVDDASDGNLRRFWTLQDTMDRSLTYFLYNKTFTGNTDAIPDLPDTYLYRYPLPPHKTNVQAGAVKQCGMYISLAYMFITMTMVVFKVTEKEDRITEVLKLMGLRGWISELSWWAVYGVFYLYLCLLFTGIFNFYWVGHSDFVVTLLFFLSYSLMFMGLGTLISALFNSAKVAAAATVVLTVVLQSFFWMIQSKYNDVSKAIKTLACLSGPSCGGNGLFIMSIRMNYGQGVTFDNWNSNVVQDEFTFRDVIMMQFIDFALYTLLAWYISVVFPGAYGVPKPFYFFITPSYWCSTGAHGKQSDCLDPSNITVNADTCEKEPADMKVGVQIRNLRKQFGKLNAVDDLSLNMYEGQITSFLGHNGAGKTTTMNMLTGLYPCSGGDAIVNGYSIRDNIDGVRSSLGLCPQHDVLFGGLTVEEHLWFFCSLKNVPRDEIPMKINEMLVDTNLVPKRYMPVSALSGGMKRKLSVAIALVGDSKVVLLDEPTAGMDPYARRATWDLLLKHKTGRTMLLTTHFMDEADLLGDRIAIVHSGKVCTVGSSLFLKSKYGIGYSMSIVKGTNCVSEEMINAIRQHVAGAECVSDVGTELTCILPKSSACSFAGLLKDIEARQAELGFLSYGLCISTLEEVFLKVGEIEEGKGVHILETKASQKATKGSATSPVCLHESSISGFHADMGPLKQGCALKKQQFNAMIKKRIQNTKRDWKAFIAQLVIPVAMAILGMVVAYNNRNESYSTYKQLSMNFAMFEKYDFATQFSNDGAFNNISNANMVETVFGASDSSRGRLYQTTSGVHQDFLNDLLRFQDFANITDSYVSFERNETGYNTYFDDSKATQASPVALNFANNVKLGDVMQSEKFSIETVNWPLPASTGDIEKNVASSFVYYFVALLLILGLGVSCSYMVIFLIHERVSNAKHMQFMTGVSSASYWMGTFVWDFFFFAVAVIIIGACFYGFSLSTFTGEYFAPIICLSLLYGFALIPLVYCFTFVFDIAPTGFVSLVALNVIIGQLLMLIPTIITMSADPGSKWYRLRDGLNWGLCIFPQFAYGHTVSQFPTVYAIHSAGGNKNIWDMDEALRGIIFLAAEGVLAFLLLFIIEKRKYNFGVIKDLPARNIGAIDDDVLAESERVKLLSAEEKARELLRVEHLGKVHPAKNGNQNVTAVRDLTFGVQSGTCFGLLGVNGAGKTTTFKMLTGDYAPSHGTAYIAGYDISTSMHEVRKHIGYCPQFDALIESITGRELLTLYGLMRGIQQGDLKYVVNEALEHMGLIMYADKPCGSYSGGNKRKLSCAIAIIGDPAVVFLDEPTTGMDPKARRFVWNAIANVFREGRSVVLTSHSMEECEALCTRLGIMVNGEFKCMGSPQHLRNKFGRGFNVMVKISPEEHGHDAESFKQFIREKFPSSKLKEEHYGMYEFELIRTGDFGLGDIFECMESIREKFFIEDYSVAQTTLEQIFVDFAKAPFLVKDADGNIVGTAPEIIDMKNPRDRPFQLRWWQVILSCCCYCLPFIYYGAKYSQWKKECRRYDQYMALEREHGRGNIIQQQPGSIPIFDSLEMQNDDYNDAVGIKQVKTQQQNGQHE
eukprot:Nk52_evm33s262 gene=Nk52_evmTU33s262